MVSVALAQDAMVVHDVEVSARRSRRRFSAAYKLKVLEEAATCTQPGALGALLRREGLYSSHLTVWRAAMKQGKLAGLSPRRGPKPADPRNKQIADLERRLARAVKRAEHAEALVRLQKKVAQLLGQTLPERDDTSEPR
jgi:transposase-like protein